MTLRSISLVLATAAMTSASLSPLALAQNNTVVWQDARATALGNGCPAGSVAFIAAGNDITVLFSELGVNMPIGGGDALQQVKNCNLVIPAKVARGLYLAELTQTLNYSILKTARSQGRISTQSVFFGNAVKPIEATFANGQVLMPAQDFDKKARDRFEVNAPAHRGFWCGRNRSLEGNFVSRLRTSGSRSTFSEGIELVVNQYDVRFQVTAKVQFCPAH